MDSILEAKQSAIMSAGMNILVNKLGPIDTETFVMLIKTNTFDYTDWQRKHLYNDMSIEKIFEHCKQVVSENTDNFPDKIRNDILNAKNKESASAV